jgi:two-component system nitrogen regulation sensor histidine kinase NtrY
MSSFALTLLGVTLVLVSLIGGLVMAVMRLRAGMRREHTRQTMSEEVFMATAMKEVLAAKGAAAAPVAAPAAVPLTADAAIVSALPAGVLAVRQDGVVTRANAAALRLLGLDPRVALPARSSDLLNAHPALLEILESPPAPGASRLEVRGPDRSCRVLGVTRSPMAPQAGQPAGVFVVLTDLTDLERVRDLEHQRATRARVAALSSALTHELANNLTGVHGYARIMDAGPLGDADRTSLDALQRETEALSETIEGFRLVTRPIELARERFPVRWLVGDAVRHVVTEMRVPADAVSQTLPEGLEIDGDRVVLEEALMHVVRNALEAAAGSASRPLVRVTAQAVDPAAIAIVVEDAGPGVPAHERSQLFEPFFSTKSRHQGLGLARARHIAQCHDGTLAATCPAEGGLRVTLTIPFQETATSRAPAR